MLKNNWIMQFSKQQNKFHNLFWIRLFYHKETTNAEHTNNQNITTKHYTLNLKCITSPSCTI